MFSLGFVTFDSGFGVGCMVLRFWGFVAFGFSWVFWGLC